MVRIRMLAQLRVHDLVLIEDLSLALSPGFNVLTGETGAGKSLVATAIHLLLGRKTGPEIVRRDAEVAEVEGIFEISDEPGVRARLESAGLPVSDELLIRRVIPADGRQRCFVNGRLSSLAVLAELADGLASFAGQHEHLAILAPSRQRDLVDAFGALADDVAEMRRRHSLVAEAATRHAGLLEKERDRAQRLDYLSYQLEEIDSLAPEPGEIEALEREIGRLTHLELLLNTTRRSADELYEKDGSVYEQMGALVREIERAARHDETLAGEARNLAEAGDLIQEAARRLSDYAGGAEADPERLDQAAERLDALVELTRKHRMPLPELIEHRHAIAAEVSELSRFEEAVAEATADLALQKEAAVEHARSLSAKRTCSAAKLSRAVSSELEDLALDGARFTAEVEGTEGDPGPTGIDRVEFLVALNPGEGAHALRKVASGGELSRLMLAVRRAVAGVGPVGTYVFDEVDAGIGGAVAAAVGQKLGEVAAHHQVVCVTHLPQIAGLADEHLVVAKSAKGDRTVTEVRRLTKAERVQEVARMLGGERLTEKTKAAARELMKKA